MGLLSVLLLSLLICFPKLSIEGATTGLLLWYQIIIPTLAPFLITTQMVVSLGGIRFLTKPFAPIIQPLFHVSLNGSYILLCGLLCGYPLGAKLTSDFLLEQRISKKEASYLFSICNHPSPMFLAGYVRLKLYPEIPTYWIFLSLYLPIVLISVLSKFFYQIDSETTTIESTPRSKPISLENAIHNTCSTMVLIGGNMMLFSILGIWLANCRFIPPIWRSYGMGFLEITTGVCQLAPNALPVIACISFGGLSGIFQTKSVIKSTGLSIRHYLFWKLIHAMFACLTFITLSHLFPLK